LRWGKIVAVKQAFSALVDARIFPLASMISACRKDG